MSEELFRKKSIDNIHSPDNLNDYVRVTNPGVWLLLVSIIVLLVGACIWGFYGHIDSTIDVNIYVESGTVSCYVDENDISKVTIGMEVNFGEYHGTVAGNVVQNDYGWQCLIDTKESVPDGIFSGTLLLSSIRPASLILD